MNIIYLNKINLKKLKEQKGKALFLIIPIFILLVLTVIISSQVKNFQDAANQSIFGTIAEQSTLLQVQKATTTTPNTQSGGPSFNGAGGQSSFQQLNFESNFSETDLASVENLEHVVSASLNSSVPITNISSSDLFENTTYKISSLSELDSISASLYIEESFEYVEGEPIPIILNANTFTSSYEDWAGKTQIDVDFSALRRQMQSGERVDPSTIESSSPVKTEAINYSKEDLIGKTFTIEFGGLDTIQDYKITQNGETRSFVKLSDSELQALIDSRKSEISAYWNYDKIAAPQTYTFIVVGVIDSNNSGSNFNQTTYVPAAFANNVMKNYIQNQLDAKTSDPSTDLLDKTYLGLSFDGSEFSSTTGTGFSRSIGSGRGPGFGFQETTTTTSSYNIPGLVIKTSSDGNNTVEGVYTDANAYQNSIKHSSYITLKIDSVDNRSSVVAALNKAGYALQDANNQEVINTIQNTIQTVSTGFTVGFILIIIAVIIFAMLKFVADSRKEIGIFRAIGMKKIDVIKLFTSQALMYTFFAYLLGVSVGIILNILSESLIANWFSSLIGDTIKKTYNVVQITDAGIFARVDLNSLAIYSLVLLLITLLVSLIPAIKASNISPVEAIKGE